MRLENRRSVVVSSRWMTPGCTVSPLRGCSIENRSPNSPGKSLAKGMPSWVKMLKSMSISPLPRRSENGTFFSAISVNTHPNAQMSTPEVYSRIFNSNSGLR